ncbi:MAG: LamG-like jellyroll fold domain-containing protein [Phycisphaeraceae bacterium]
MADRLTPEERLRWLNTVQRYFDRQLPPPELESFNTALQRSSALRRLFLDYSRQTSALLEILAVKSYASFDPVETSAEEDGEVLLRRAASASAHVLPPALPGRADGPGRRDADADRRNQSQRGQRQSSGDSMAVRRLLSLAGYLLGQALTSKPAYKAYGIAAALLVAVTLVLVFSGDEERAPNAMSGRDMSTHASVRGGSPVVTPTTIVATLVAEHDAFWDRRPGQDLFAGQRFTLTAGFAEFMTASGAVVVLQAPATIEFIDHPNALRLVAGKLVGICETESSKGFVVKTEYADVVDLGTEFGVEVEGERLVTTVLSGEVVLETPSGMSQRLVANQTASLTPRPSGPVDASLVVEERVAAGYERILRRRSTPAEQWDRYVQELDASQGLVGQVAFDAQGLALKRGQHVTGLDARLAGGEIRSGDQPGRANALAIRDETAGVDLLFDPSAEFEQMTLVAWVRMNRAPGQLITALMHRNQPGLPPSATDWQIRYDRATIVLDQDSGLAEGQESGRNEVDLTSDWQGRWHCFVAVMDAKKRTVEHYLDGQPIGSSELLVPGNITLGKMRLGGLGPADAIAGSPRHLNGDLGLFVCLEQALTPGHVQSLYEASRRMFQ